MIKIGVSYEELERWGKRVIISTYVSFTYFKYYIMKIHLLLTEKLKETIPSTIKIKFSVENVTIRSETEHGIEIIEGDNVILEGSEEDIINWLKPFDGIWIGNGIPQLEQFTIKHIK